MSVTVEVVNIGPIRRAKLELGRLNVLMGDNNTGKTFFATILHRILMADVNAYFPPKMRKKQIPDVVKEHVGSLLTPRDSEHDSATPRITVTDELQMWANEINRSTLVRFGDAVRNAVSYAYGVPLRNLRRQVGKDAGREAHISVTCSDPAWHIEIPFTHGSDEGDSKIVCPEPQSWLQDVFVPEDLQNYQAEAERLMLDSKASERSASDRIDTLCRHLLFMRGDTQLFRVWPNSCLHLPSERGGIMQGYRSIASAALKKSSLAGLEPIEIEPLDGTSRDFLSFILNPKNESSPNAVDAEFAGSANRIEAALGAEIDIAQNQYGLDRVLAETTEGQFEFNQVSSMITELSSLVLALKYRLGNSDYLTIDEPEAHLHPALQIEIARGLFELVDAGLSVTLTTHSDYFVEQIKNAVRMHELSLENAAGDGMRVSHTYRQDVRALLFVRTDDGCIANDATGDAVDPIDESTFAEATRSQYEESTPLISQLLELRDTAPTAGRS